MRCFTDDEKLLSKAALKLFSHSRQFSFFFFFFDEKFPFSQTRRFLILDATNRWQRGRRKTILERSRSRNARFISLEGWVMEWFRVYARIVASRHRSDYQVRGSNRGGGIRQSVYRPTLTLAQILASGPGVCCFAARDIRLTIVSLLSWLWIWPGSEPMSLTDTDPLIVR